MSFPTPEFLSRFATALPGDRSGENRSRVVTGALWSTVAPTPVKAPRVVALAEPLARELGLDPSRLRSPEGAAVLSGNAQWPGMVPYANAYGGHQFGNWAGQLGDGRAITLGELVVPNGGVPQELQLKGAGPTPYSRRGDGRAVLRSSIREFLCSEAMHALGVPTTRALSLVVTGEDVVRDMFYDGNAAPEPGAIVCRVAPSFLRFGNFELPTSRGDHALLKTLTDFALTTYFPELGAPSRESYAALLREVGLRTARLMAQWQAVGFVHGVMNTDNLSLLGLTIDYGPYGWVDDFDPDWTPNTTDAQGRRYRFGNQPSIGLWNLERLGIALMPLWDNEEAPVAEALGAYQMEFERSFREVLARKLGFASLESDDDDAFLQALFAWLRSEETDYTIFFRGLSGVFRADAAPTAMPPELEAAFYGEVPDFHRQRGLEWVREWWTRARRPSALTVEQNASRMDAANPRYVLRNWLAQEAIDAAHAGDFSKVETLLRVMSHPYEEKPGLEHFAGKRPEWARNKPGSSQLSCSS